MAVPRRIARLPDRPAASKSCAAPSAVSPRSAAGSARSISPASAARLRSDSSSAGSAASRRACAASAAVVSGGSSAAIAAPPKGAGNGSTAAVDRTTRSGGSAGPTEGGPGGPGGAAGSRTSIATTPRRGEKTSSGQSQAVETSSSPVAGSCATAAMRVRGIRRNTSASARSGRGSKAMANPPGMRRVVQVTGAGNTIARRLNSACSPDWTLTDWAGAGAGESARASASANSAARQAAAGSPRVTPPRVA